MAHKTLIGCLVAVALVVVVAFYVTAAEYEVFRVVGADNRIHVSGTTSVSYVTSSSYNWIETLQGDAGLYHLCYYVTSNLGTPQVKVKYQVAPSSAADFVDLVDSAGTDISQIVDDTSNIGGNGYYCIPGDYFPTWTNSIRLFPWGRLIFYGTGTNPTDTFMSNVWLIRY
jgi:hypothetical protein